jgi:hypothetical protein
MAPDISFAVRHKSKGRCIVLYDPTRRLILLLVPQRIDWIQGCCLARRVISKNNTD